MDRTILKTKFLQPVLLVCLGVVLIFLSRFSFTTPIKTFFSYAFEPIMFSASNVRNSVSNWSSALFDASSYIDEYTQLKDELIELQSSKDEILDYEEINSLKESSSIIVPGERYILSKVLGVTETGDLYINAGTQDGIKTGDIVFVGNVFIGIISDVGHSSSLVTLPTNRRSTYEVVILSSDAENVKNPDEYIKSRAVISGQPDGIKIENIESNSDVSDGDTVVIRDQRVDKLFIVGRVVSLSTNPAATSKSGFVSPVFDYTNLLTVFVKIE